MDNNSITLVPLISLSCTLLNMCIIARGFTLYSNIIHMLCSLVPRILFHFIGLRFLKLCEGSLRPYREFRHILIDIHPLELPMYLIRALKVHHRQHKSPKVCFY
jgi:hypothetical protein